MTPAQDKLIKRAVKILETSMRTNVVSMLNPATTQNYVKLSLANREHEVFGLLMLDSQHRLIVAKELFRGTIDGASVYPREVIKEVIAHNAAAVIFYHNHPSGIAEPSTADRQITRRLTEALQLIDIRVLDHIIAAGATHISFAERGLL